MSRQQRSPIFDAELELKDAGLVAASAAAQVDGSDQILDLGAGRVDAVAIVDITAIEVATGDEKYEIELQFSSSSTFAADVLVGPTLKTGDSSVTGSSADTAAGRYELPFTNEFNGTRYRYMRAYTRVAGTIATGINFTAFVAKVGEA